MLGFVIRVIQVEKEDEAEYSLNHIEVTNWSKKDPLSLRRVFKKVRMLETGNL